MQVPNSTKALSRDVTSVVIALEKVLPKSTLFRLTTMKLSTRTFWTFVMFEQVIQVQGGALDSGMRRHVLPSKVLTAAFLSWSMLFVGHQV